MAFIWYKKKKMPKYVIRILYIQIETSQMCLLISLKGMLQKYVKYRLSPLFMHVSFYI